MLLMDDVNSSDCEGSNLQGQLSGQHHVTMSEEYVRGLVCQSCWSNLFSTQNFWDACNYDKPEVFIDYAMTVEGVVHYPLRSQIEDGKQSCHWCSFLYDLMSDREIDDKDRTFKVEFKQDIEIKGTPEGKNQWSARITPHPALGHQGRAWGNERDFCAYTSSGDKAAASVTARPFVVEVDTTSAMDQIKLWLKACKQHATCPIPVQEQLPTRVIDVGTTESFPPKLYVTGREQGQYAALSYCWGGPQKSALVQKNLDQYRRSLPMDKISQSIKDAIKVARAVGMRYLWVDAICIIQDSDDDKDREISAMDGVYRRALFTISAESAATAQEGFLSQRHTPTSYQIPFRCPDGSFGTMCLFSYDKGEYSASLDPLETRAWSFQESILSTRRAIFSSKTLKWLCPGVQCHIGRSLCQDTKGYARAPTAANHFRQMLLNASRPWGPSDKETWSIGWQAMVHIYSGRKHSDPSDRLIALSGVVKALASAQNLVYVAGLWRDQLVDQLLWYVPGDYRLPRPPLAYRAPSWSWASLDDQIFIGTYLTRAPACEIIECEVVPLSRDVPYGAVRDGWLVIEGPLQQGDYRNYTSFQEKACIFWKGEDFLWKGELPEPKIGKISRSKSMSELRWNLSFDSLEYAPEGTATFLVISQSEGKYNSLKLTGQIAGLILNGRTDGTYQRIGHFESFYQAMKSDLLDLSKIPRKRVKIF